MSVQLLLHQLAVAYAERDDIRFANALVVSAREGLPWRNLKQELANVGLILEEHRGESYDNDLIDSLHIVDLLQATS
jgi:hypothetical protein